MTQYIGLRQRQMPRRRPNMQPGAHPAIPKPYVELLHRDQLPYPRRHDRLRRTIVGES